MGTDKIPSVRADLFYLRNTVGRIKNGPGCNKLMTTVKIIAALQQLFTRYVTNRFRHGWYQAAPCSLQSSRVTFRYHDLFSLSCTPQEATYRQHRIRLMAASFGFLVRVPSYSCLILETFAARYPRQPHTSLDLLMKILTISSYSQCYQSLCP